MTLLKHALEGRISRDQLSTAAIRENDMDDVDNSWHGNPNGWWKTWTGI